MSIKDFRLSLDEIEFFGTDFSRPESILAQRDGTLYVSDNRGGVKRVRPDGSEALLPVPIHEVNGITMDSRGNLYLADINGRRVFRMHPDGSHEVLLSEFEGQPLGPVNYIFVDSRDRLWISIMTREEIWFTAAASPRPDGYILLMDENGVRKVFDGVIMPNEIRLDAKEEYLYCAETMAKRIVRFKVLDDAGNLGPLEVYGPADLGVGGYVDGFTFDAEGNVWVAMVLRNGLLIITPDGAAHTIFEDPNEEALAAAQAAVNEGRLTPEGMFACVGPRLQFPTSITFAGDDLRTVYMGSLAMPHLLKFRSPVAGLPMRHWA